MRWRHLCLLPLLACSSSSPGTDANVPPIVDGGWYRPTVATTWQWQLKGSLNEAHAVAVYDVDLFDTPVATIARLKSAGRKVLCYFSAGSSEDWRDDAGAFEAADKGFPMQGWEGENWLDIRSENVLAVMRARLDVAVQKGCDGVEPDNVDGYLNLTGFPLSAGDQLAYNRTLANEAHARNLAVALKNDGAQAGELVEYFDLSLNEQCHELEECGELAVFVAAGKPIFNAEYDERYRDEPDRTDLCNASRSENIRTLVLPLELDDSHRMSCDE